MVEIEPLSAACWERIANLLASHPYKPYMAYVREFGEPAITNHFLEAVRGRLDAAGTSSLFASQSDGVAGFALWSVAPQESHAFGFQTARLEYLVARGGYAAQREIKRHLVAHVLERCLAGGIRHISLRVAAADAAAIHALEEQGFIMVDGLITYARRLGDEPVPSPSPSFQVRLATPADLPQIMDLARSAFSLDRLHIDPAVPKAAADEIHGIWLAGSCSPGSPDRVLVAVDAEGALGYSVYRIDRSTVRHLGEPLGVWVIAAAHERARGMGVAMSMCLVMLQWYKEQGIRIVEGGTQLANVASARLHESCGFHVASTSVSLSKWIGGPR
ncbi:MAG TPA: GNAT family N-acetyltransferase [Anaerolineae bacterium]|nr:GNAT family N-acetyltransferase [Anaerolineae bacterium]